MGCNSIKLFLWKLGPALILFLILGPVSALGADMSAAKEMVENTCSSCHRFSGEPTSRFNLKAPDLMWGGNKYQHDWLVRFLQGKEEMLYPNGYRWDQKREKTQHMTLGADMAEAMARYIEKTFLDPRIKKAGMEMAKVTEWERDYGKQLFREFSCIGCHQVQEEGKPEGGPISTTFFNSGKRYNLDWIYAFNSNPQNFTPHSGEYLADVTERGLHSLTGYLMTLGVEDFEFYKPWEVSEFKQAKAERGKKLYMEYCAQCHGPEGEGDGVGALGLTEPAPAKHSQMALSELPMDYLYNVIYYGGKSVGKSSTMPDWGLTIHGQEFADLIAYLRASFTGGDQVAQAPAAGGGPLGECPQPRKTKKAPAAFLNKKNPLDASSANIRAGESLYMKKAKPVACMQCHGKNADGNGPLGGGLKPKPRNFTCGSMMADIPDGQLFWIIKQGSPGTGMMPFPGLKDDEIWQLVHYIRSVAK